MAPSDSKSTSEDGTTATPDTDLAQAFADLARGEKTAQALESHLTSLEAKIDALLASVEENERQRSSEANKSEYK